MKENVEALCSQVKDDFSSFQYYQYWIISQKKQYKLTNLLKSQSKKVIANNGDQMATNSNSYLTKKQKLFFKKNTVLYHKLFDKTNSKKMIGRTIILKSALWHLFSIKYKFMMFICQLYMNKLFKKL